MHDLGIGFWWVNVFVSTCGVFYWVRKRMGDGTPALMTPGGQVWAWQLIFSFIILGIKANPWHLAWLWLVSFALSVICSNIYRSRMLAQRYPAIENGFQQITNEPQHNQ
jgi:hypothetical protein